MDILLPKIGHIAVAWNEAEHVVNRMLWLYLDTDAQTAAILTKPLRATDREKLLRVLVEVKETNKVMASEIVEAIKLCATCRENRNTILHNLGGGNGEFASDALETLSRVCDEITSITVYLRDLQLAVTKVIFARAGDEEAISDVRFEQPKRPLRPAIIAKADILPEGYDA